jgi:hypothetical protein
MAALGPNAASIIMVSIILAASRNARAENSFVAEKAY